MGAHARADDSEFTERERALLDQLARASMPPAGDHERFVARVRAAIAALPDAGPATVDPEALWGSWTSCFGGEPPELTGERDSERAVQANSKTRKQR